jgi:hypothetical protein
MLAISSCRSALVVVAKTRGLSLCAVVGTSARDRSSKTVEATSTIKLPFLINITLHNIRCTTI